jgi:hypothetical protein
MGSSPILCVNPHFIEAVYSRAGSPTVLPWCEDKMLLTQEITVTIAQTLRAQTGYLSPRSLSTIIRSHPQTIYGWCRTGQMPHIWVGARIKFDPATVADWLDRRQVG